MRRGYWVAIYGLAGVLGALLVLLALHLWDDHRALHILAEREGARIAAEAKH